MKGTISDKIRLEHIVEAIAAINSFVADKIIDDLYGDGMLRSAVRYQLTVIGEAANNLTDETRKLFPQIEWRKIVDTRNIITHGYALVDEEIIWHIIKEKLPELDAAIKATGIIPTT
ncbi:nucleotidyltransferase [Bacteroidia bacterium]|nr:nucleotidyltransferase [Bacteroidia bacterium]